MEICSSRTSRRKANLSPNGFAAVEEKWRTNLVLTTESDSCKPTIYPKMGWEGHHSRCG